MRIEFAQGARTEFKTATNWYVRQAGSAVAQLFRNEVRTLLELLAGQPAIGAQTVGGARFVVLKRFPFSVVYRQAGDVLVILAIAHHKRRPGYWVGK